MNSIQKNLFGGQKRLENIFTEYQGHTMTFRDPLVVLIPKSFACPEIRGPGPSPAPCRFGFEAPAFRKSQRRAGEGGGGGRYAIAIGERQRTTPDKRAEGQGNQTR